MSHEPTVRRCRSFPPCAALKFGKCAVDPSLGPRQLIIRPLGGAREHAHMTTLYDLIPDAESVLALEPEELAGVGLELITFAALEGGPSRLHPSSFTHPDSVGPFPQHKRVQIEFAMAEGWNWLVREGLIAPAPGDTFGWHFVTRRGAQLKNRTGVAAYISSVQLPRAILHPVLLQSCWPAYMGANTTRLSSKRSANLKSRFGLRENSRLTTSA